MQMTLNLAVDLYLGDIARRHQPATLRKYRQILGYLQDDLSYKPLEDISRDDIERWLNRWQTKSKTTMALHTSIVKCFFRYLVKRGTLGVSPAENIDRPKLPKPEDRDVVTVSWQDVEKMIGHCETWQESITFGLLAYLGPRRNALSKLRWRDVDLDNHRIRFFEKGNKSATKVMERGLLDLFRSYQSALTEGEDQAAPRGNGGGSVREADPTYLSPPSVSALDPDAYVIPNSHPNKVRRAERDNRIVWDIVRRVAKRAGVHATTHSLRAAFAVHYLEMHPGQLKSLQAFLGHDRIDTTQIYLRKLQNEQAMEVSKDLDWGFTFGALSGASAKPAVSRSAEVEEMELVSSGAPLSALTEGEVAEPRVGIPVVDGCGTDHTPSVSASSEPPEPSPGHDSPLGVEGLPAARSTSREHGRADGNEREPRVEVGYGAVGLPATTSSRRSAPGERLAAHHEFPTEPVEAHTGFEPVLPENLDAIGSRMVQTDVGEGNDGLPDRTLDMFLSSVVRSVVQRVHV